MNAEANNSGTICDENKTNDDMSCDNNSVGDTISNAGLSQPKQQQSSSTRIKKKMTAKKDLNIEKSKRGRKRKSALADEVSTTDSDRLVQDNRIDVDASVSNVKQREKKHVEDKEEENLKYSEEGNNDDIDLEKECLRELGKDWKQLIERQKKSRCLKDNLDRSLFTVTDLTLEQQIREVEQRKHLLAYTLAQYRCTTCYRGFSNERHYTAHSVKHDEVTGSHVCVVCRVRAPTWNALRKHVTASHTRQYSCKVCPFVSRFKAAARQHQNFHAGTIYKCPHCPMFSNNYTTYQNHVRIKHASAFACALCGYTFANENGLSHHKKIAHRVRDDVVLEGPYCDICDVRFFSEEAYERHLLLSSNHVMNNGPDRCISNDRQRNFAENDSDENAQQRSIKRRLGKVDHAGVPVVCEQCGVELRNRRTYAQHFRRVHPGCNRTQFSPRSAHCMCELCGQVFSCNAALSSHMWRQHEAGECRASAVRAERPARKNAAPKHECPICGKLFKIRFRFQRHMFSHTGQRPYKCDQCSRSFKTKAEKETHAAHVHMKKPWPKRCRTRRKAFDSSDEETCLMVYKAPEVTRRGSSDEETRLGARKNSEALDSSDDETCLIVYKAAEVTGSSVEEKSLKSKDSEALDSSDEETCLMEYKAPRTRARMMRRRVRERARTLRPRVCLTTNRL